MKDGQTIGQWLNWDFKTNGFLEIRDKNGNKIYISRIQLVKSLTTAPPKSLNTTDANTN